MATRPTTIPVPTPTAVARPVRASSISIQTTIVAAGARNVFTKASAAALFAPSALPGVEAEPPEPQECSTEQHVRDVVREERLPSVIAARPEHERRRERSRGRVDVDDGAPGVIEDAQRPSHPPPQTQCATGAYTTTVHSAMNARYGPNRIRSTIAPGNERGGDDGERGLVGHEQEMRDRTLCLETDVLETEELQPAYRARPPPERQGVGKQCPGQPDDSERGHTHHHGIEGVLGANQAAIEERQGRCHEQHERRRNQHPDGVGCARFGKLRDHSVRRRRGIGDPAGYPPASHRLYPRRRRVKQFVLFLHKHAANLNYNPSIVQKCALLFASRAIFLKRLPPLQISAFHVWTASASTCSCRPGTSAARGVMPRNSRRGVSSQRQTSRSAAKVSRRIASVSWSARTRRAVRRSVVSDRASAGSPSASAAENGDSSMVSGRRARAPIHLVPWEPHWRLLGVPEQGPRAVVDIAGVWAGDGNVYGMPRAERVDAAFPRLALDSRAPHTSQSVADSSSSAHRSSTKGRGPRTSYHASRPHRARHRNDAGGSDAAAAAAATRTIPTQPGTGESSLHRATPSIAGAGGSISESTLLSLCSVYVRGEQE